MILIVGTPFDFRMGYGKRLSQDATVVQIDMDYRRSARTATSPSGSSATRRHPDRRGRRRRGPGRQEPLATAESWLQTLRDEEQKAKEERLPKLMREDAPVHPLRLAHEINEFLTDNTVYIGDGGDVVTFSGGVVQPRGPGLWMDPARSARSGSAFPSRWPRARSAGPRGRLPVRRRHLQPHRLGLRDDGPLRPSVHRRRGNNSYMNQIRYGQIQKYGEERGTSATSSAT